MAYVKASSSQRQTVDQALPWLGAPGEWEFVFNGYRVSVWDGGNILGIDGGDGCTEVQMYLMPLNCILNSPQKGKFYVIYILPQFNKKHNCPFTNIFFRGAHREVWIQGSCRPMHAQINDHIYILCMMFKDKPYYKSLKFQYTTV